MQLLIWISRLTLRLCLAGLILAGSGLPAGGVDLGGGFRNPPDSARPWVYWFWLDGNITKEGITADLEAMHRVGLGGALWMWGGGVGEGVKGPVKFLSPEWWELMRHTVREADRLGLKINLTAGSGWSHTGGPWIKPEHSMQRLELSQEIALKGPGLKDVTIAGGDPLVAVLAYRMNEDKNTMRRAGVRSRPVPPPGFSSGQSPRSGSRHALDLQRRQGWRWPDRCPSRVAGLRVS